MTLTYTHANEQEKFYENDNIFNISMKITQ